jgi:uncharacterized DUF497 family protein
VAKYEYFEWLVGFIASKGFDFDWDDGYRDKSHLKHSVTALQIESAFDDPNAISVGIQVSPETIEARFAIIGKDFLGGVLFICFTIRAGKVRPISARLANKIEKRNYE